MKIRSTLALLGTLAALAAGGAAQASDIQVTVRIADRGWSGPAADVEGEDFRPREFWRHEPRAYRRHGFEDRRIVERPHWARPVFARPWEEDCRVVIKRRVDPWGDVVVRRFRVCG